MKSLVILGRRPVARGAIISIVVRIVALGLGFLQAIMTARLLGPEGFGTVAFALSIATIAATFAMLGFGPLAVREVARLSVRADWTNLRGFLRFSSFVVFVASLATAGIVAILALKTEVFDAHFRGEIAVASLMVPPIAVLSYFRGVQQGLGRILSAQVPGDLLRQTILIAGLSLSFLIGLQVTTSSYLVVTIGAGFIAAIIAAIMFWMTISRCVPKTVSTTYSQPWARAASPFLAMAMLGVVGVEINTLLLGWLSGPKETGLFQPVARIAPVMLIGLQAVNIPFAPRVAALWEQGESARLYRITWMVTLTTTGVTILVCASIVLFTPLIFSAFGEVFLVATEAVLVVALAQMFNAACGPVGMLLSMTGYQGTAVRCQAGGLVANTMLCLWLIPTAGAYGAAIGYAGGIVVWNVLMLIAVSRVLGFNASLFGALRLVSRESGG